MTNKTPGKWVWSAFVSKSGERYPIDNGTLNITRDLASVSTTYDGRSHVKKVLDAIEATIEGTATKEQTSMSIAGRTITRRTVQELLVLKDRYKAEYIAQQ